MGSWGTGRRGYFDMKCKIAAMAGAIIGWGGAGVLIVTGTTRQAVLAQAFLIGVGMVGAAWLMLCSWRRPIAESFAYGYAQGVRDAHRDLSDPGGGGRVIPLRSVAMLQHPSAHASDAV